MNQEQLTELEMLKTEVAVRIKEKKVVDQLNVELREELSQAQVLTKEQRKEIGTAEQLNRSLKAEYLELQNDVKSDLPEIEEKEKGRPVHDQLTENVVEGFERLKDTILDKKAPKIKWLPEFNVKEDIVKANYLKKLASTMNNAAKLISDERDALVQVLVLKEKQLESMTLQMQQNDKVLQNQIIEMNSQKQRFNSEMSHLSRELRMFRMEDKKRKKAAA